MYMGQTTNGYQKSGRARESTDSALAEHAWSYYHPMDCDNTRLIQHYCHAPSPEVNPRVSSQSNSESGSMLQVYNSLFYPVHP